MAGRDATKKELGQDASVMQVAKLLTEKWKNMTPEERMPYDQKAKEDKERYERELKAYEASKGK